MNTTLTVHRAGLGDLLIMLVCASGIGLCFPLLDSANATPLSSQGCPAPPVRPDRQAALLRSTADFVVAATPGYQWDVDGVVNPTLTLTRGETYTFDLSAITDEHPFLINSNATNPWGTLYVPAAYGQIISFTPDMQMPATIYYHCEVHYGGMAGTINLVPPACTGDLTADGQVNVSDFIALNSAFGATCAGCPADMNNDGVVNVGDFLALNSAYGNNCGN